MTRKRGYPYAFGQTLIMATILILLYSYFYYAYYASGPNISGPFSLDVWITGAMLSLMTVFAGILIEFSRFWGWVIQYKFKQELLILQGIPSGILGVIPSTVWTKFFEMHFPFNFLADPAISAAGGVWFGVILIRSFLENKRLPEEEEEEEEKKVSRTYYR